MLKNNLTINKEILSNLSKFLKAPNYLLKSYRERFKLVFENLNKEMINIREKKTIIFHNTNVRKFVNFSADKLPY